MKILFLGDVIGRVGREGLVNVLPKLKAIHQPDLIIANAENAAGGSGVTPQLAEELFKYGADVLTTGDHIWNKREIFEYLDLINAQSKFNINMLKITCFQGKNINKIGAMGWLKNEGH